ncbi:MAG: type II toxin-antitoxin system PemK/MazF family toxin [Bacillota bacterium]|jgi:mRNA interferase MazF
MPSEPVRLGDVLTVELPRHIPALREQEGVRPAVVVGPPKGTRCPVIVIVPLTTEKGPWTQTNPRLYPGLPQGEGGLVRPSISLIDQVRSIDVHRVLGYLGTLSSTEFERIQAGLRHLLEM